MSASRCANSLRLPPPGPIPATAALLLFLPPRSAVVERRRPDDRRQFTIHALDRRLARIESLLQTRLSDSRLEQQLIRIEGVLRERLPLRQ